MYSNVQQPAAGEGTAIGGRFFTTTSRCFVLKTLFTQQFTFPSIKHLLLTLPFPRRIVENMSSNASLPEGWSQRESKSHPGKMYYINSFTGETTWTLPTSAAQPAADKVQCYHILRKHRGSRRPASWRQERITQSKDEAIAQIESYRADLMKTAQSSGYEAMFRKFQGIAYAESDCGSHERGGDLGLFGRGEMQKAFEEVGFGLEVGELSGLVDTDSGIHIILRVK